MAAKLTAILANLAGKTAYSVSRAAAGAVCIGGTKILVSSRGVAAVKDTALATWGVGRAAIASHSELEVTCRGFNESNIFTGVVVVEVNHNLFGSSGTLGCLGAAAHQRHGG